jgi:hypothetical protein
MLNLDITGKLPEFSKVFDLAYYHANRHNIIKTFEIGSLKGEPLDQDIIALIRNSGFNSRLPLSAHLEIAAHKTKATLRGFRPPQM